MDADDIAALFCIIAAAFILALAWYTDRENQRLNQQFAGHQKVTATGGDPAAARPMPKPTAAERRPPQKNHR